MGVFDGLKKKKQAGPSQQPTAQPASGAQAPLFSPPQQPGQFPAAGGVQPAQAPQPMGFFGGELQQAPPQAKAPAQQPLFQQQPRPMQQRPAIPSFPKLSSAPGQTPARPSQPVAGQRRADAAAVKAAVQRQVAQPVRPAEQPAPVTSLFGAPAASESTDFFSELQEPPPWRSSQEESSFGSSLGLVPLDAGGETPAERPPAQPVQPVQPAAPPHSKGRDAMLGDQLLFVAVQDYVSILDSLKDVRKLVKEFEKRTHSIDSLKTSTLSSCKSWQGHLDDIHRKLAYIDHVLFER